MFAPPYEILSAEALSQNGGFLYGGLSQKNYEDLVKDSAFTSATNRRSQSHHGIQFLMNRGISKRTAATALGRIFCGLCMQAVLSQYKVYETDSTLDSIELAAKRQLGCQRALSDEVINKIKAFIKENVESDIPVTKGSLLQYLIDKHSINIHQIPS